MTGSPSSFPSPGAVLYFIILLIACLQIQTQASLCLYSPLPVSHQHPLSSLTLHLLFLYSQHLSVSLNLSVCAPCHPTFLRVSCHLSILKSAHPYPPCLILFLNLLSSRLSFYLYHLLTPFILPSFYLPFLTELYTEHHSCICRSVLCSQSHRNTHTHLQIYVNLFTLRQKRTHSHALFHI